MATSRPMPIDGTSVPPLYEELVTQVAELAAANFRLRARADQEGLILDSATDFAIITLNVGGQITNWNTGAERLFGYGRKEAVGLSGAVVFTPEDRAGGAFIGSLWTAFEHGSACNERWHVRRDGTRFWASGTMMPLLDTDGMVCGFLTITRDRTAEIEAQQQREFLLSEARHKSKNTFATVYAVAARHAAAENRIEAGFFEKLAALSRSHDLLDTDEATLGEVVERSLAPYEHAPGQARATGPMVRLNGRVASVLNSTLHELATNAAKYGAFSVPGGRVEVSWTAEANAVGLPPRIVLTWREIDGPAVVRPSRRGFGTRVIEGQIAGQDGGAVQLDFEAQGVTCRIQLPSDSGL